MAAPMPVEPPVLKATEADLDARISEWRAAWEQAEADEPLYGRTAPRVLLNVGAAVAIAIVAIWAFVIVRLAGGCLR